jgi:glyoxylase-like metal-dependent hydrolase (beta-lactamase superfamily II)
MSHLEKLSTLGIHVLERGWLSSNCILLLGSQGSTLVDSGYHTHANQTLLWLKQQLKGMCLDRLINTHLHSDHCGGNAALQSAYPNLLTDVPHSIAPAVRSWNIDQLSFVDTGQDCPPFHIHGDLADGQTMHLGGLMWRIFLTRGHDPDSVVLFQEDHRILISADALWENGFGVVFPELTYHSGFDDVELTLNMIEALEPAVVIPGHGPVFDGVEAALTRARSRLAHFRRHPDKHARHAIKVLIKFKLLEWQRVSIDNLMSWCQTTPLILKHMPTQGDECVEWMGAVLIELSRSQALRIDGSCVLNE